MTISLEHTMKMSQLFEEKASIRSQVPDFELSDTELIQRVKAYGKDAGSSYGLYVRARNLKPNLNMKEFSSIFNNVNPNPHNKVQEISFSPTHEDSNGMQIMVTVNTGDRVSYIIKYGPENFGTGGDPIHFFDARWKLI
jgi:hypothetical protein